ncbi:MAG: hypothetical protein Q8K82_01570 [Gemmatimonadaceae bacterium]|nr:hypothetical protein [Gemmatimonadaceae bacterium]
MRSRTSMWVGYLALTALGSFSARARAQGGNDPAPLAAGRGVAQLPRDVPRVPRELTAKPCTRKLKDNANLQDALDRAKGGDVVCLFPGASYVGNFVLRNRGDTSWVVVRSDLAEGEVARAGERIRPSKSAVLSKLVARPGGGASSALVASPGARGWYLLLLEITTDSLRPQGPTALISLGGGDLRGSDRVARYLVLDRVYAHGWPEQTLRRCVALNSGWTAIVDSWLDECHEKGADSQAISGSSGPGPFLIENNTLAGAGENVMFGGSDPRTPGLVPSDIVLRRNHIVTPPHWMKRWTKKNIVETKNVRRLLIEENVIEGSWADGQDGYAIVLKSANQSGQCRWCISADIIVRRNLVRNVGAGINVNGLGGARFPVDSTSRRIEITENYIEGVGAAPYRGAGRLWMLLSGTENLLIAQNTAVAPPNAEVRASVMLGSRKAASAVNLVFERNVMTRGRYAIAGCGNPKTMMECLPGGRFSGNILIGASRPEDRFLSGFLTAPSEPSVGGRAGMSRSTIERATAGVVVER